MTRAGYFKALKFIPLRVGENKMSKQKNFVADRNQLVNLLTKEEGTKRQATVNAMRNAFKLLIQIDMKATMMGLRSPLTLLRKESLAKIKAKKRV